MSQAAAPRSRARRGEGERLRIEIVDAASRILAVSGDVNELSLRRVAREVGVAATSIYLHFRALDELIMVVKARFFEEFGSALDAAAEQAGEARLDRVRARAHEYVRYALDRRGAYRVMFSAELPEPVASPTRSAGLDVFGNVRDEIADVVGSPGDADLIAVHYWTALHGIVTLRTVRRGFPWPDVTSQVDDLVDRLLWARD